MTRGVTGLMGLSREEVQRRAAIGRAAKHPLQFIGGGPWVVSNLCRATKHNTVSAARGQRIPGRARCMCPRALVLLEEYKANGALKAGKRLPGSRRKSGPHLSVPIYMSNIVGVGMPDLLGGLCQREAGQRLAAAAVDGRRVQEMKDLCTFCPVRQKCEEWVLADETPAGSWGGVYAGMSVADRRRVTKAKQNQEAAA